MSDKKIEIEVPEGYKLVQDGMKFEFVKKDERFLKWGEKDSKLSGYCVDRVSEVYAIGDCPRFDLNRKTFATESQAKGMIAMAMLSQQLADVNGDWEPEWGEGTDAKYCIYSRFSGASLVFDAGCFRDIPRFLALKTKEDAEKFLDENIKEIKLAKDFI
jgi:hypothetical protein